jgi:iron-sulfur cluster repair protein YtfE (RIC family)
MTIQIGAKLDSGFDNPIGMLVDCHRRIERFLYILGAVVDRALGRVLTAEEAAAVQSALEYFRSGGQRHTADEEESLFPWLRAGSTAGIFDELIELESDHRIAGELHQTVDTLYSAWITSGLLSSENRQQLLFATKRLRQLYEAHIQVEERIVFPRAVEVLDSRTIATMGREFHARRR